MLERVSSADGRFSAVLTDPEFDIISDLHEVGLVAGNIGAETLDQPRTVVGNVRLTIEGQGKMEELLAARRAKSVLGVVLRWLSYGVVYASGIGSAVVTQWLAKKFGE